MKNVTGIHNYIYCLYIFQVITVPYLHMDKQAVGSLILWWDTGKTSKNL